MKKIASYVILACVVCITSCSCQDDPPAPAEPTLPPITQSGENTFGCYINGSLWLPEGGGLTPRLSVDYYNHCVLIRANRVGENPITSFTLDFGKVYEDTTFSIHNYSDSTFYQYFLYSSGYVPSGPSSDYFASNWVGNQMNLTKLDTINRIIAGTFNFIAIDSMSGDSIVVSDGRFDLSY